MINQEKVLKDAALLLARLRRGLAGQGRAEGHLGRQGPLGRSVRRSILSQGHGGGRGGQRGHRGAEGAGH